MFEVTLVEWTDGDQGVRLVGRSSDPALIKRVREHLHSRIDSNEPPRAPPGLRIVPRPEIDARSENETDIFPDVRSDLPSPSGHSELSKSGTKPKRRNFE